MQVAETAIRMHVFKQEANMQDASRNDKFIADARKEKEEMRQLIERVSKKVCILIHLLS